MRLMLILMMMMMMMMVEGKQKGNKASGLSRLYTDQQACEVGARQDRVRIRVTQSDACLVPTPNTPPVTRPGQGGTLPCPRNQAELCRLTYTEPEGELPSFPRVLARVRRSNHAPRHRRTGMGV